MLLLCYFTAIHKVLPVNFLKLLLNSTVYLMALRTERNFPSFFHFSLQSV